ncbi:MAG: hypothetical protein ABIR91_00050 [Candidatus Saccharimonadales bacterium]
MFLKMRIAHCERQLENAIKLSACHFEHGIEDCETYESRIKELTIPYHGDQDELTRLRHAVTYAHDVRTKQIGSARELVEDDVRRLRKQLARLQHITDLHSQPPQMSAAV